MGTKSARCCLCGGTRALRVHHIRTRAVPESIRVRCQGRGLQCGSVRIGSAVCGSLREFVCVSGILFTFRTLFLGSLMVFRGVLSSETWRAI